MVKATQITQKIIFVTGKGGVGKSLCAAALAEAYSRNHSKTLLVELGEHSFYRHIYPVEVTAVPRTVEKNLHIACWNGEQCLREYILHYLRIEKLVQVFFENKIMKALIQAAPALSELALLGKITSGIRRVGPKLEYDVIVVDAFSTGHFRALLQAPRGIKQAIGLGPIGEHSQAMMDVIMDPSITQFKIVSLPEELPVSETLELTKFIQQMVGITPDLYLNRMWSPGLSIEELKNLEQEIPQEGPTKAFCRFVRQRLMTQNQFSLELSELAPVKVLPQVFKSNPREVIEHLAGAIL